jgi:hypothetical protein
MAWRPKTVAGKILKGLTIGVGVAAAGLLVVGTAGAVSPAIGGAITAAGGVAGKVLKAAVKTVDFVGTKAADLVSPINEAQRALVKTQTEETKAEVEKLTAIDKLVKAGSTVEKAAAAVGVPLAALAGTFGIASAAEAAAATTKAESLESAAVTVTDNKKLLMYAGIGLAALFILPKLLKSR